MSAIYAKQGTLTTSSVLNVASITTSGASAPNGIRVSGGQGQSGTGENLRVTGTGDLVNNTSSVFWRGNSVDTQVFELSWLGFNHLHRANAATA